MLWLNLCPQAGLPMFCGPIILKQSSRDLLNALRFSQGSLSILLRSMVFGLMIWLRHHGFQYQVSTCKGLRHNMISRVFSHLCFVAFFYSIHPPHLPSNHSNLYHMVLCVCVCMEFTKKLSAFLQLIHKPHLFGLHFRLSSFSPSHHSNSPLSLFFSTHLFLSISLPLSHFLSYCWSIFGAELAERGKEACKIEETGCWRAASLSPWLVYASGMIPNTR